MPETTVCGYKCRSTRTHYSDYETTSLPLDKISLIFSSLQSLIALLTIFMRDRRGRDPMVVGFIIGMAPITRLTG